MPCKAQHQHPVPSCFNLKVGGRIFSWSWLYVYYNFMASMYSRMGKTDEWQAYYRTCVKRNNYNDLFLTLPHWVIDSPSQFRRFALQSDAHFSTKVLPFWGWIFFWRKCIFWIVDSIQWIFWKWMSWWLLKRSLKSTGLKLWRRIHEIWQLGRSMTHYAVGFTYSVISIFQVYKFCNKCLENVGSFFRRCLFFKDRFCSVPAEFLSDKILLPHSEWVWCLVLSQNSGQKKHIKTRK